MSSAGKLKSSLTRCGLYEMAEQLIERFDRNEEDLSDLERGFIDGARVVRGSVTKRNILLR